MSLATDAEHTPVEVFNAVVTYAGAVILNEDYPHASARRDAIVALLRQRYDAVSYEEVEDILLPFGGANADVALGLVIELYQEAQVLDEVDVILSEPTRDLSALIQIAEESTLDKWRKMSLSQQNLGDQK